jgi:hypothetical protein
MFGEEPVIGEHDSDGTFEAAFEPDDVGFTTFGGDFGSVGSGDAKKFEHRGLLSGLGLLEDLVDCSAGGLNQLYFCGGYAGVNVSAATVKGSGDPLVPSSTSALEFATVIQPSEVLNLGVAGHDDDGVPLGDCAHTVARSSGSLGNSGFDVGDNGGGNGRLEFVSKHWHEVRMKFPKILPDLGQIRNVDASRRWHR